MDNLLASNLSRTSNVVQVFFANSFIIKYFFCVEELWTGTELAVFERLNLKKLD